MDDSARSLPRSEAFFRDATLRICGSLDMAKSVRRTLDYVSRHLPAEGMHVFVYDQTRGSLSPVAGALQTGAQQVATADVRLPAQARRELERGNREPILIIDRMSEHPIGAPLLDALGLTESSAMVVVLQLEGAELGALFVHCAGVARFTQHQAELLGQLNEPCAIALMNHLRYHELQKAKELLVDDNRFLSHQLRQPVGQEIIGADFGLLEVMRLVREVAPLPSPVLLLGETGTGKELIAGAIHNLSNRRDGSFIKVNCGAIPPTLIDSELFGHERGAFTGAVGRKRGLFERAHGGTIFLDEVGELHLDAQVRLLRVLQEHELERVGGAGPIQIDVRVIAATHRNLTQMIESGAFRKDLYYRLEIFPIQIPALRQRKTDIPVLAQHLLHKKCRELGLDGIPSISPHALNRLLAYTWPGNVRELENAVERELILSRGSSPLRFAGFDTPPSPPTTTTSPVPSGLETRVQDDDLTLDTLNRKHIRRVLALTRGRVEGAKGAAQRLDVHPSTLRNRMRKLGIPFGRSD
jgi:transcriptional regulator with GAF, ATPase, and Fis domain